MAKKVEMRLVNISLKKNNAFKSEMRKKIVSKVVTKKGIFNELKNNISRTLAKRMITITISPIK